MKKLFFFIIILYLNIYSVNEDLLYVEFVGDTVKIWNNVQLNCCSQFKFETEITEGKIKLIEIDTSKQWCKCICNFNLCASLIGLEAGSYQVDVFRKLPPFIPPDSLYFVGTLEFNYLPGPLVSSYQSNCLSIAKTSGTAGKNFIIKDDSLYVEFSFDTVKIWNTNVVDQCCAKFKIETEISNGLIKLNEIDTSGVACDCICRFNLCGIIVGLQTGNYKVEVYRAGYFVGSIDFYYPPPNQSVVLKSFQSECLYTNQDEIIIYSNSFESPLDTIGLIGYGTIEFRNEAPPGGGNQSLFISGGCIWPHAKIELPPSDKNRYLMLSCWGKNLEIGGEIAIETKDESSNYMSITIDKKEWTYYQTDKIFYCPANKKILLTMGAGGIAPSAMLIDLVQVANLNPNEESYTSEYWFSSALALAKEYKNPVWIRNISADNVSIEGKAKKWEYKFMYYDDQDFGPAYLYIHNTSNDIVLDSISLLVNDGEMNISDNWFESDSAIIYAELHGGKTFRENNPDFIISATLSQALIPDSYPCWQVIYCSKSDSAKKLLLYFDARNIPTDVYQTIISPDKFLLEQNYPNPFNPTTKIKYTIPAHTSVLSPRERMSEGQLRVILKVYDILGNEVATLVNEEKPAGSYEVEFDGTKLSSGIYFYVLKVGENRINKKMCLLK